MLTLSKWETWPRNETPKLYGCLLLLLVLVLYCIVPHMSQTDTSGPLTPLPPFSSVRPFLSLYYIPNTSLSFLSIPSLIPPLPLHHQSLPLSLTSHFPLLFAILVFLFNSASNFNIESSIERKYYIYIYQKNKIKEEDIDI